MKEYFIPQPSDYDLRMRDTLYIPKVKSTRYRIKSLRFLGPKIWNSLPDDIKAVRQYKSVQNTHTTGSQTTNAPAWPATRNNYLNAVCIGAC